MLTFKLKSEIYGIPYCSLKYLNWHQTFKSKAHNISDSMTFQPSFSPSPCLNYFGLATLILFRKTRYPASSSSSISFNVIVFYYFCIHFILYFSIHFFYTLKCENVFKSKFILNEKNLLSGKQILINQLILSIFFC